jgi:hypothetical protein
MVAFCGCIASRQWPFPGAKVSSDALSGRSTCHPEGLLIYPTSWAGLTEAQHQQVTESYAAGAMVHSQIVKTNGERVQVNYMMRKNGDAWLIRRLPRWCD